MGLNFSNISRGVLVGSVGMLLGGLMVNMIHRMHDDAVQIAHAGIKDSPQLPEEPGCHETARLLKVSNVSGDVMTSCKADMFIENIELESGDILILCRCTDPLACLQFDLVPGPGSTSL